MIIPCPLIKSIYLSSIRDWHPLALEGVREGVTAQEEAISQSSL